MDAAGLLRTAIRCDDPVMFLEHKHLYRRRTTRSYQGPDFMIPMGKGSLVRDGEDVVVLTWGALVSARPSPDSRPRRTGSARRCSTCVRSCPYDWEAIARLVARTSRVVIAHEAQLTCGFGAELAARIAGELFEHLDAPVRRVAALNTPVAYCPDLEEVILPQSADVLQAIRDTARY